MNRNQKKIRTGLIITFIIYIISYFLPVTEFLGDLPGFYGAYIILMDFINFGIGLYPSNWFPQFKIIHSFFLASHYFILLLLLINRFLKIINLKWITVFSIIVFLSCSYWWIRILFIDAIAPLKYGYWVMYFSITILLALNIIEIRNLKTKPNNGYK